MPFRIIISGLIPYLCCCSDNLPEDPPKRVTEEYELKVNANDRFSGIEINHGPTDGLNYTDSTGIRYFYSTVTTTITNDTTLPVQIKISFLKEYSFRTPQQSFKVFIVPESLTPMEELKKRFDVPIGGTITLNATESYVSKDLKRFLDTQKENSVTLNKIIQPKEKSSITIGIYIDSRYSNPGQLALVSKGHCRPFFTHDCKINQAISSDNPLALFFGLDFLKFASVDQCGQYTLIPCGQISFQ